MDRPHRPGHTVFRHAFVPVLLALLVMSWTHRSEGEGFLRATAVPIDFLTMVLLLSILSVWFAEQVYPENPAWNYRLLSNGALGWNQLGRDLLYLFVISQITRQFLGGAASSLTSAINRAGLSHPLWPSELPFPVKVLLAFLIVELASYWFHRACHHFRPLWQFHSTHHVIAELNGIKALRTHPIDNVFFYLTRHAPLLLVGAGVGEVLAATYFGSVLGILAHANLSLSEGVLGWGVNFPRYHSVHHSSDIAETQSNFGCHTILWDRIFGTFQPAPRGTLEIGVRPVGPRSLWQELVRPFYRWI